MKKLLLISLSLLGFFIIATLDVKADHGDLTYHRPQWNNSAGTIPITVSYEIRKVLAGVESVVLSTSTTVAAGQTIEDIKEETTPYGDPYKLRWWTDCTDPDVDPFLSVQLSNGHQVVFYPEQDVACRTTNGDPQITSVS